MTGIGEIAYTVLLGWMRALVDWIWSMVSGTGNSGVWSWFLSNWKLWLLILIVGGLVVDWLMWVMRWRPYRVLMDRFRRKPAKEAEAAPESAEDAWDNGVGYYEAEIPADTETADWSEITFATLSEVDPNWAGEVNMENGDDMLYDPDFTPPRVGYDPQTLPLAQATGSDDDESMYAAMPAPQPIQYRTVHYPRPDDATAFPSDEVEEAPAQEEEASDAPAYYEDDEEEVFFSRRRGAGQAAAYVMPESAAPPQAEPAGTSFDPLAPYDAYDPQEVAAYETEELPVAQAEDEAEEVIADYEAAEDDSAQSAQNEEMPLLYGRPGVWPGAQFPIIQQEIEQAPADAPAGPALSEAPSFESPSPVPEPEYYDPLFNPDAPKPPPRRRRRRLMESAREDWRPEDPIAPAVPEAGTDAVPMPTWMEESPVAAPAPASIADASADIPSYLEESPAEPVAEAPAVGVYPSLKPGQRPRTVSAYGNAMDPLADTRPSRVVRPASEIAAEAMSDKKSKKRGKKRPPDFRTVTGKPAKARGLARFASMEEEAIAGLPPLQLTDPFLPKVQPENVDFADDDGREFYQ